MMVHVLLALGVCGPRASRALEYGAVSSWSMLQQALPGLSSMRKHRGAELTIKDVAVISD